MRFLLVVCLWAGLVTGALAEERTLSVTGEGRVEAVPDMAVITLGVMREDRSAGRALAAASEAMRAVMDELEAAGVAARDMQTSNLSLDPVYDRVRPADGGMPKVVGFRVSNMLTVRVRELDRLGGVIEAVVADGANALGGLYFTLQDESALLDEARRRAVADARGKAEVLAEAAGVTLGPLMVLSEIGGGGAPMQLQRMEMAMSDAVPVAAGEVGLMVRVSLQYAMAE